MYRRVFRFLLLVLLVVPATFVGTSVWLALISEWRFPPVGRFVDVDEQRLHLLDSGEPGSRAPGALPLVLIHGASTSLLDLRAGLGPALTPSRRVVFVDRPGHGYSTRGTDWADPIDQARSIREGLRAIGIDRAIWVGHSWGGAVLMAALVDMPEAVAGVVSIAGVSHPWEGDAAWHAELAAREWLGPPFAWQFIESGGRLTLRAALQRVFEPEPIPDGYLADTGVVLSLRPWVYRHNAADLTRLSDYLVDLVPRYDGITRPYLSITGTADDVVPAWNHAARLDDRLPQHRWVRIEGAGHGLHHTRAARIAELTLTFAACVEHAPHGACPLTAREPDRKIRRPVRE